MDLGLLVSAALGAAIVVIAPGPAVLAFIGIGAAGGRWAGAQFLFGHLFGDLLWAILAVTALVGANILSPGLFHALAGFCGAYLLWLGGRALFARKRSDNGPVLQVSRPYVRGIIFGISNPKSYPVTLSVFTGLLAGQLDKLTLPVVPAFLAAYMVGCVAADLFMIWLVGLKGLRRFYARNEIWIVRSTGAMFIGFALNTLYLLAKDLGWL